MRWSGASLIVFPLLAALFSGCTGRSDNLATEAGALSLDHSGSLVRNILKQEGAAAAALSQLQGLFSSSISSEHVPFKHPTVVAFLSNPAEIEALPSGRIFSVRTLSAAPSPAMEAVQALLKTAGAAIPYFQHETHQRQDLNSFMAYLYAMLEKAASSLQEAFSDLSGEEQAFVIEQACSFLTGFCSGEKDRQGERRFIELASKIRQEANFKALADILPLFSEETSNALKALSGLDHRVISRDSGSLFEGDILYISQTPLGLIMVGGKGPNVYNGDAALIVDLGGDDIYLNNAGSPVYDFENGRIARVVSPVSVVIDVSGNDLYISTRIGSQGAGLLGIGILLDLAGNDTYSGGILTQGAGFLGLGLLADLGGGDIYSGQEIGQGAGVMGTGMLFDAAGDDRYAGAKFVQGFGGPGGTGMLVDASGNDVYKAGVKYGSTYGTRNVWHTVSQGAGWGLRGRAAGGIGILEDLAGDDFYNAGNFSQGTGYYLGMGILSDSSGDDRYTASRYSQGSAAHLAVGVLADHRGNDQYFSTVAASKAGAWDLAVAWFMDLGGDDLYQAADLSFGASAQNALAVFLDASGTDRYTAPSMAFGLGGELTYEGGRGAPNLGVFLDMSGGWDIYEAEGVGNDRRLRRGLQGLFVDE